MKKSLILLFTFLPLLNEVLFSQFDKTDDLTSTTKLPVQTISVTIGGSFNVTGSFPASPFERVDQFVTRIYNLNKTVGLNSLTDIEDITTVLQKAENFARRDIELKKLDGSEVKIDLEKFRVTGDYKYNPYLKNDDVLIFPPLDLDRNYFSIDGAVNRPIKVQFVEGDKLPDALLFAQGINKAYENVTEVEITRLSYDGSKEEVLKFNINDNVELKRGDRIRVLAEETNRKDFKVLVIGDVFMPGYIPITKNSTTVKKVIEKAGGFKPDADLNRTELIKVNDPYKMYKYKLFSKGFEQNQLLDDKYSKELFNIFDNKTIDNTLMARTSNLSIDDSIYFSIDNRLRLWRRESLVNFSKLEDENSPDAKYIAEDGDLIIVPVKDNLVYVFGQVAEVGYQKFEDGKDAKYYINQAGGLSMSAQSINNSILIKGKSRNWMYIEDENAKVEPGDYIWVPKSIPRSFTYYLTQFLPIASLITSVATLVLVMIQLRK